MAKGVDLSDFIGGDSTRTHIAVSETRPEHSLRLNYDIAARTIWVTGEIEDDFGSWFQRVVWTMEQDSHEPITVWLNTPGGSVPSMFTFYDCVISTPCTVKIIGHGEVISAGVLMLACGDERYVTENCVWMSHQGADFESGGLNYKEMLARKGYWDWTMNRWNVLMARHSNRDAGYWKRITLSKAELWLLGGAAIIAEGLADGIYDPDGSLVGRYNDAPVPAEESE